MAEKRTKFENLTNWKRWHLLEKLQEDVYRKTHQKLLRKPLRWIMAASLAIKNNIDGLRIQFRFAC